MNQNATDITRKFIPRDKQIDGNVVSVTPFTARRGLNLQLRLIKIIGPAIKSIMTNEMFAQIKSGQANFELPLEKLVAALESALSGPNSDDIYNLIIELMSETSLNGLRLTETMFDTCFVDEYLLMYKVLFFVLEVNFSGLLKMGNIGSQPAQ